MLVAFVNKEALAAVIAHSFEAAAQTAPEAQQIPSVPSTQRIKGVLQAVEDQTAPFPWNLLYGAVAAQLGLQDEEWVLLKQFG